jgi:hypothetical protein
MAKRSRRKANSQQQAKRVRMAMRQARIRNAKKTGKPLIPDRVLQALAALKLPNDKAAYNARFQELQGSILP